MVSYKQVCLGKTEKVNCQMPINFDKFYWFTFFHCKIFELQRWVVSFMIRTSYIYTQLLPNILIYSTLTKVNINDRLILLT